MKYDVVLLASKETVNQLRQSIESIKNQSIEPQNIIVVSNNQELLESVNIDSIYQSQGGIGKARELGYKKSRSKWVLFTDADTLIPENFVQKAMKYATKYNLDAVGGKVRPVGKSPLNYIFSASTNMAKFGKGHSTLIRSDIDFEKVNSDRGEDSDIWQQAHQGKLLDQPKVITQIPTVNHKKMTFLFSIIVLILTYRWLK